MKKNTISLIVALAGYYILSNLTNITTSTSLQIPDVFIKFYLLCLLTLSFSLSIKMWKWYDRILDMFSITLRIVDIATWIFVLWFFISHLHGLYMSVYTWGGLTTVGIITIGILRLFIKRKVLHD